MELLQVEFLISGQITFESIQPLKLLPKEQDTKLFFAVMEVVQASILYQEVEVVVL